MSVVVAASIEPTAWVKSIGLTSLGVEVRISLDDIKKVLLLEDPIS